MWTAQIEFDGSNAPAGSIIKHANIYVTAQPISTIVTSKHLHVTFACNLYGKEKNKQRALQKIKNSKKFTFTKQSNSLCTILLTEVNVI